MFRKSVEGPAGAPLPRWTLYMAKLMVVMTMTAASTFVLVCGMLIDGAIPARVQTEVVFGFPVPWAAILRDGAEVMGLAFLALTIQHWVSLRWRSSSVVIGSGIITMVAGGFAAAAAQQNGGWPQYVPWALPMLVLARQSHNIEGVLLVSGALGVVVSAAGCWDFCRREVT